MNDDFEKRLQRRPLRQIPSEWREDILKAATLSDHSPFVIRHSVLSTLTSRLSSILWPHPKAWAGLAGVWVVIFALQFASRGSSHVMASISASQPSTFLMSLKDQQQTLAELMGYNPPNDADQPRRVSPQPRSELRTHFRMA